MDPNIPFDAEVSQGITLTDPNGPHVGDLNGDGGADVIVFGGRFQVFETRRPTRIRWLLTDAWFTHGAAADDPALESYLSLSRFDAGNSCAYPRRCVVCPRRVVSGYALSDESGGSLTRSTELRVRRMQGLSSPFGSPAPSVEAYMREVAAGSGANVLRDTVAKVIDFDDFGDVLVEELTTSGVDLTLRVERTFKNDIDRWVLGQLQSQKECSTAAMSP